MYYTVRISFWGNDEGCYLTKDKDFKMYGRSDMSDEARFFNLAEAKKNIKKIIDSDWKSFSIEKIYANGESGGIKKYSADELKCRVPASAGIDTDA